MYNPYRPKLFLPKTTTEKLADAFGIALIIYSIGFIFFHWSTLPLEVPTHFNAKGVADGWGSKYQLLILPIIAFSLFVMLEIVERKPHLHNYPARLNEQNVQQFYRTSRQMLNYMKNICMLLFTYISIRSINLALGKVEGLGIIPFFSIIFLLFLVLIIGLFRMIKIK